MPALEHQGRRHVRGRVRLERGDVGGRDQDLEARELVVAEDVLAEIAGGRNVFGDLPGPSPEISFEELLRRNPDVVMVSPSSAATLLAEPRWRSLPAVRDHRVLLIDTLLTMRPGVRLGEAAVSLARLLHPGVVP